MAGARVTEPRVVGEHARRHRVVFSAALTASRLWAPVGQRCVDGARRPKFNFCTGTAAVNKWWDILYQMNLADGALLNETAWSALVGMSKKNAREAAKAELAAE